VTKLIYVDLDVKLNGQYYRDVLQSQQLLAAIKHVTPGDVFVFHQDSAVAHRACDTIYCCSAARTPDFIGPDPLPPNSDCKIWGIM